MTHGDMTVYVCDIPAGIIVAGMNTVTLGVTSNAEGPSWLSPNYMRQILVTIPSSDIG